MNRDEYLYQTMLSSFYDANLVDYIFLRDYEMIKNIKVSDDEARREVKDAYVELYKHHVILENLKQYLIQNIITYKALNDWDLFVELKNGDKFIYDGFTNSVSFDFYESDDLTEEQMTIEFSKNLRKTIRRKFITQDELARKTGISRLSINRYINGKQLPDYITLRKLSNALGCPIEDFYYKKY